MKHIFPMYEGDSIIRSGMSASNAPTESEIAAKLSLEELHQLERDANRLRAEVMSGLFARAVRWISEIPARARQRAMDARVGNPSDVADLEYRLRSLERGDRASFV
jgi:hypothetical protein